MKKLITFFFIIILTGCASGPAYKIADLQKECELYGYAPGTDSYADCMMELSKRANEKYYQARQSRSNALQNWANSLKTPNTKRTWNRGLRGAAHPDTTYCTSKPGLAYGTVETECY